MKIAQAPINKGAQGADDPNAAASAGAAPFHALMQALADLDEKPKGKPAKKDQANDLATSEPATTAKESKPPMVWALPQTPVPMELAAPKTGKGAMRAAPIGESADDATKVAASASQAQPQQPLWNPLPFNNGGLQVGRASTRDGEASARGIQGAYAQAQAPATAQDSNLAQLVAGAASAVPLGGAQTSKIAFEANLRAAAPEPTSAAAAAPAAPQHTPRAEAPQPEAQVRPQAAGPIAAAAASSGKHEEKQDAQPERQPKAAATAVSQSAAQPDVPPAATNFMAPAPAAPAPAPHTAAAPTPVAAPAPVAPIPDPVPVPAAATDIKIALNDNGQRVELRVTDRAGDIHVTVRTPDAQLATSLRSDLPVLSSKLEQSGFHSDMWRPAAGGGAAKTIETAASNLASDSRENAGGRQQRQQPEQDPRNPQQQQQQQQNRKSDRKEFTWLLQSIR
jgi:hypothetical protein